LASISRAQSTIDGGVERGGDGVARNAGASAATESGHATLNGGSHAPPRVFPGQSRRTRRIKALLAATDLLAVTLAFLVALDLHRGKLTGSVLLAHGLVGLLILPLWAISLDCVGLYDSRHIMSRAGEFHAIVRGTTRAVLATTILAFLFDVDIAKPTVLYAFPLAIALLFAERELIRRRFARLRAEGHFVRTVLIVGANEEGKALATAFDATPSLGYRSVGFVDDVVTRASGLPILGRTDDALAIAQAHDVSGVLISVTAVSPGQCTQLTREFIGAGLQVELASNLDGVAPGRMVPRPLGGTPVVALEPARQLGWRAMAKRTFDVVAAALAIVLLSPLLLLTAIAIRLESRGPVVFRQQRVGRDAVPFTVFKFRSMVVDAEERLADLRVKNKIDGPLFKLRDDPRITRVGKIIRRYSIDELPQLLNVLRGDMSVVGPRPALPTEVAHWDAALYHRLRVRPGLTGMWQVAGRSESSFEEYARLDLYYVDNWSLVTDLSLVLRTVPALIRPKGAY
jgi:exopolysaccharide biosynthesis polyprenyl glycosylphosphotransferase